MSSFDIRNLKLMETDEMTGNMFISLTMGICISNLRRSKCFLTWIFFSRKYEMSPCISVYFQRPLSPVNFFRNMTDALPWKLYYAAGIRGNVSLDQWLKCVSDLCTLQVWLSIQYFLMWVNLSLCKQILYLLP